MSGQASHTITLTGADSLTLHRSALQVRAKDSLKEIQFRDSFYDARLIHWDRIAKELRDPNDTLQSQVVVPSVFRDHKFPDEHHLTPVAAQNPGNDWMLGILLAVVLMLGAVRQLAGKRLAFYLSAFIATRFAAQLQREEYAMTNRTAITLFACFILTAGLFIFQLLGFFGIHFEVPPFLIYLYLCGGLLAIYLVKILVIRMLAFIFRTETEAGEYIFYTLLFNQVLGMILLPIVTGLAFIHTFNTSGLMYCGLAFFGILFIYRLLRGVWMGLSKPKVSRFYLFLYLCTLEFLPVVFAIKYLSTFR
ncbi:MAG TPA: DUF4271 domain-containing protein [Bacteroidia bacterium]|jgi:hypothetical protein